MRVGEPGGKRYPQVPSSSQNKLSGCVGSILSAPPPSCKRATLLAPPPPQVPPCGPPSKGGSGGGPTPPKPGLHSSWPRPSTQRAPAAWPCPSPPPSPPSGGGAPHLADHAVPDAIDLLPVLAVGDQVEVVAEADGLRQPLQNVDAEALAAPLFRAGGVRRRAAGSEQAWGCWGPPTSDSPVR